MTFSFEFLLLCFVKHKKFVHLLANNNLHITLSIYFEIISENKLPAICTLKGLFVLKLTHTHIDAQQ